MELFDGRTGRRVRDVAGSPTDSDRTVRLRGATLKKGPRVCKTVALADYGDPATGELRTRELIFLAADRHPIGPGYDFDNPRVRWWCENEEVERLLAFLHSEVAETGRYRVVDTASPIAAALDLLSAGVR